VAFSRVGNVQVAQGDLAGALKSYQDSRDIIGRLAKADPGNASGQRDLAVSYNKIGDVQKEQGDLSAARQETGWRNPTPAMRAGSAIWR
jgi:predicted Zn-dependent protease